MINTNLLKEILHEYNLKRSLALQKCDQNKQNALNIKEFGDLDKQERALVFEIGKKKFEQKDYFVQTQQLEQIKKEKQKVLTQNGIDERSLSPIFECEKCKDTGYINGTMCACLKQAYNNKLMQNSCIDFKNVCSLTEYDYSVFDNKENMQKIVANLQSFVDNFDGKIKNVVLVGATGTGKSYISKVVAKDVIKKGYTCLFVSSFRLNSTFLQIHTSKQSDKMLEIDEFLQPDLLIIDDLGTEPMLKNVTKEYLLILLNERILSGKNTLVSTNLLPNELLDKYGERVFSRLFDKSNSVCYFVDGKDLRIKK